MPELDPLPDQLEVPVLLKVGDDVSTYEILPAGARVLPFRSNIEAISEFALRVLTRLSQSARKNIARRDPA